MEENTFYYGDNLELLRRYIKDESKTWGKQYPKIQLLTIAELLSGKKIDIPPTKQVGATFKKVEKIKGISPEQLTMKEK